MSGLGKMKKLFTSKKGPLELVESAKKHLALVSSQDEQKGNSTSKAGEKISIDLSSMKFMLYGDGENDPKQENIKKLVDALLNSNLLLEFLKRFQKFEFEARKDVAQVYNFILRYKKESASANAESTEEHQAVTYIKKNPEILTMLVTGYAEPEIALNCGSILREVIRHETLNNMLLENDELFNAFFEYVELPTFDVASDAFATFKLMLTKHRARSAKFLEKNYEKVFEERYNLLLMSRNYVTKRQSLKLLGDLLHYRSNFNVMMRYINSPENLKIMMNLLRGTTKTIQFEAFYVFKIFVANPKKSPPVLDILVRNKDKLVDFLTNFQKDKDDEQFNEEKQILLQTLGKLAPSAPAAAAPASANTTTSASTDDKE